MSSMAAEVVMKKGKRATAAYIQGVCSSQSKAVIADEVLDVVMDPLKRIDDWETLDWIRWILAGGLTPEEFAQTVRTYDNATTCGLVWTANFVAYRCRTCGISPCMSLCSTCFQGGNHEGHDFNMFRSQAGGACDCGDKSVMKETGFCQSHGPHNQINKPEVPHGLLCVAETVMPRLFLRIIEHFRENYRPINMEKYTNVISEADRFLVLLHSYSEMGAAMREVMTHSLINPKIYSQLALNCESPIPEKVAYLKSNLDKYIRAKNCLLSSNPGTFPNRSEVEGSSPEKAFTEMVQKYATPKCSSSPPSQSSLFDYDGLWNNHNEQEHLTFLDELVFWTIKFEFPQKLVCLLLNMMPDLNYKEAFIKTFVHHYDSISRMLANSVDSDTLSNRVVHVSVQLFSNEELAHKMTKEYSLLHIMVQSLQNMMSIIIQDAMNQLANQDKNTTHLVVDCNHRIMKEHCYWPLVSDLNNVLTHEPVAFEFLSDGSLLTDWFDFLSLFQGMNVNQRELKNHVEFESNAYYAAFSAELEASATPMWALISHLKSPNTLEITREVLSICLHALNSWFSAVGFYNYDNIDPYQISFHLPLHRCFASFLGQTVRHQGAKLNELLPSEAMLQLMMMHPLQAQVAFHEILIGLWVRSGLQIKGQAMTYIQCHFCNSVVDADLFLLQLCSMKLDPDWFLKTVLERFHVWEWFTFHSHLTNSFLETDHVVPMLEGALTFLTTLLATHTNIGQTEEEVTRQEMVSLLCMSDRTHSQLMDLLPDKCGATSQNKDFESILSEVADYKSPNFESGGAMVQGMYVPKPCVWDDEYDPIHVLLRAVHRKEYQSSLDRYAHYVRQCGKFSGSLPPWPPYRIPGSAHKEFKDPRRLLQCKTMHGLIFTILYRAVTEPDILEQVLSLCIYLLDMAVRFHNESPIKEEKKEPKVVNDMNYEEWFDSNDILHNITQVIHKVIVTEKVVMSVRLVEDMEVDEDDMDELDDMIIEENIPDDVSDYIEASSLANNPTTTEMLYTPTELPEVPASTEPQNEELDEEPQEPSTSTSNDSPKQQETMNQASTSGGTEYFTATEPQPSGSEEVPQYTAPSGDMNMALIPTSDGLMTLRPRCLRIKHIHCRHRLMLTDRGLPLAEPSTSSDGSSNENRTMPFSSKRTTLVNESMLSLLLRLHAKLSEKPDSYKPPSERNVIPGFKESRVGNATHFIERLLDYVISTGEDKAQAVQEIRQLLWPKREDVGISEALDKEERRRRAKERQERLMAEFANKQKAFLQKTMELDSKEASAIDEEDPKDDSMKEYVCVICGQVSSSEKNRPMGMVTFLQATSVLGHYRLDSDLGLPYEDAKMDIRKMRTFASVHESRLEHFIGNFDNKHWQMAVNIGWEGGVHIQSCGHYLHIDCHKSYVQSLKSQNQSSLRLQNLAVDQGEYSCPLCRQLANSVIPLNPNFEESAMPIHCRSTNIKDKTVEISTILESPLSDRELNILRDYMSGIMEDMTNSTFPQYRSASSLFLFVSSVARTNLEIELVQRRGTLISKFKKKSCFVALFQVLSMHCRLLASPFRDPIWVRLTGNETSESFSSCTNTDSEVPLLVKDCVAVLLHLVLIMPVNLDKAHYSCIVQVIYNLQYIQALAQITCSMKADVRSQWQRLTFAEYQNKEEFVQLPDILGAIIAGLETSGLYAYDFQMNADEMSKEWKVDDLEVYMKEHCIHFLRIASILQNHLYDEETLEIDSGEDEFKTLCRYLCLSDSADNTTTSCLRWTTDNPRKLVKSWCESFSEFTHKSASASRIQLQRHMKWYLPELLKLPYSYDNIFKFYHKTHCTVCQSEPKDPSLCLICGTMVCLRENCCRNQAHYEAVSHSVTCGAGTAIYLAVNSSTIIVIRGKRACLWGSVYLDSYGEEDRDLKRGKPLFLCKDRYNLLQQQWISHSFDHTNKRWVWHKDNL